MAKRWQGPAHAYAEARWRQEQAEALWDEENPMCAICGEHSPKDTMVIDMNDNVVHEACNLETQDTWSEE